MRTLNVENALNVFNVLNVIILLKKHLDNP